MTTRRRASALAAAALVALALVGPVAFGPGGPPSVGASAAQLLSPGTRVEEAALAGGGFARALEIDSTRDGLQLRSSSGWRTIAGVRATGEVRQRRLWLGSDHQGRDLLSRTVQGARTSLLIATLATLVAVSLGTALGFLAALAQPGLRGVLEIFTDGLLGLPRILLLLMLGASLHGTAVGIAIAIGAASWMELARWVQSEATALRSRPFFAAATVSGAGLVRLSTRHLLPNLWPLVAAAVPLVATEAILLESTLSFLGILGGGSSWGKIVADGQRLLPSGWWIVLFPGLLLFATAFVVHGLAGTDRRRSTRPLPG